MMIGRKNSRMELPAVITALGRVVYTVWSLYVLENSD